MRPSAEPRSWLACTATLLVAACEQLPTPLAAGAPRPVTSLDYREVFAEGRLLGTLHHLAIEDPRQRIVFWRAESLDHQYLGFADAQGRFYQRVPFEERERFLGIYPMEHGLQLLYETDARIELGPALADPRQGQRSTEQR